MHCMAQHVGEFMSINGALLPFTQQGLEKYNDQVTRDYFRSSFHKGQECLTDIIKAEPYGVSRALDGRKNTKLHAASVVIKDITRLHVFCSFHFD